VEPANTNFLTRPTRLGGDSDWVEVVCGTGFGAAVKSNGTLWIWAMGPGARLPGVEIPAEGPLPVQVGLEQDWVRAVVDGNGLGGQSTMHALKADGTVWSWDPQVYATVPVLTTSSPDRSGTQRAILSLGTIIRAGAP
jgi:hypothetical protein